MRKDKCVNSDGSVKHGWTRQSEMADLARRATRWVGTFPYILTPIPNLYDHSFPRYGQITFLTFRRPTTLTFDLKFWKYLSVTVYPYVICMPSFIMIGWEMAEILHIEILRKHGQTNTHTNTQTNRQTDRHGHYNTSPSPYGGRGKYWPQPTSSCTTVPSQHILRVNYWKLGEHDVFDMFESVWFVQHVYVDSDVVDLDDWRFQDFFAILQYKWG